MARKRTIEDIARLAGVSKATVSRVLNHKPDVDPATRERILRVVEEEGFVPSITASGLAGGRSRLIGVLVASFTWPLIADIIRGVAEVIEKSPYELVLYSVNDTLREYDKSDVIDHILATKLTAGLLIIVPGHSSRYIARLHKHGFPVVMIDDQELPVNVPWIGADNRRGAHEAVKHLVRLGHRRIAHIQGPMKYLCSQDRYIGYCQGLEDVGLSPDPDLVLEGDFMPPGGRAAASQLFTLPPEKRPTAIFAGNDQMAYGVLAAAEEYGFQVPRDMALIGFDDITPSALMRPPLTTVRQPFYEMGAQSIKLLLTMLDTPHPYAVPGATNWNPSSRLVSSHSYRGDVFNASDPIRIQLATSLVVRASCGAPQHLAESYTTPSTFLS